MELYFAARSCSIPSHIVCQEADIPITLRRVNLKTHETTEGSYYDINPKGKVPTLRLEDGQFLTEGQAVIQYLADLKPETALAPPAGTLARYRLQEWLGYVSSELHKRIFFSMFDPKTESSVRVRLLAEAQVQLDYLERKLSGHTFLMGDTFTAADAYLYWWLWLAPRAGIEAGERPNINAYKVRCRSRPAVEAVIQYDESLPSL